jgi:hypothetical protein
MKWLRGVLSVLDRQAMYGSENQFAIVGTLTMLSFGFASKKML